MQHREEIGYVDRIEDGLFAVLLLDSLEKEFVVDVFELPEGAKEGTYLTITFADEEILSMAINQQETESMARGIGEKLNKIKSRSKGSRFKRS